nr:hypothetical protein RTCK_02936 [Rhizobium sp. TCK]
MPDQVSDEKGVPFDWQAAMRSMKTSDPNDPDADGYQEFYMWREILIENVRRGITTPDEAERIVEARKASPLRRIPEGVDRYSPEMRLWTPEMLLAWIAARDPADVHRHFPSSYEGVHVWTESLYRYSVDTQKSVLTAARRVPPSTFQSGSTPQELREVSGTVRPGYQLHELREVHYPDGYYGFDGEQKDFPNLQAVFPELRTHLERGTIEATGLPQAKGEPYEIDKGLWGYAAFNVTPALGGVLSLNGVDQYHRVKFKASGVLMAYPPGPDISLSRIAVRRWTKMIHPSADYKDIIVARLQEKYPDGLPFTKTGKERDELIRNALDETHLERWRPTHDAVRDLDKFRKAMDRIVEPHLEKDAVEIFRFS